MRTITILGLSLLSFNLMADSKRGSLILSTGMGYQTTTQMQAKLNHKNYRNLSIDRSDKAAWKIGYTHPLPDQWNIETAYVDFGKRDIDIDFTSPSGTTINQVTQDIFDTRPIRGTGLSLKATYQDQINPKWQINIGGGIFAYRNKHEALIGTTAIEDTDKGVKPVVGTQLAYKIAPKAHLTGEWEHYFMDNGDIDLITLGIKYDF